MKPLKEVSFTIVIPNYNDADSLKECLWSVASQDRAPDEVIFIDDNSSDGSLRVVNEFRSKIKNLIIIKNDTQLGTMSVLNIGLELAKSEFVIFLSSNDILLPEIIGLYKDIFKNKYLNPGLISAMAYRSKSDNDVWRRDLYPSPVLSLGERYFTPSECVSKLNKMGSWFMGITIAFNKKNLQSMGAFEISYGGLADMFAAFSVASFYGAYFFPRPLGCIGTHKGGLLSKTLLDKSLITSIPAAISQIESLKSPALYDDKFTDKTISRINFSACRESLNLSHNPNVWSNILVLYYFFKYRPWDIFYTVFNRFLCSYLIVFLTRLNFKKNL